MKVLLVDDQERILMATKKLVGWEKLGVDEVYTAQNAEAAREILKTCAVDIMMTDIEMPGEDGISLQKWQAENYPEVYGIFLTSHADFSYAQKAIHNGAFDYILQPASIPDMEKVISRCVKTIEKKRALLKESGGGEERADKLPAYVETMFYHRGQFTQMKEWREAAETEGDAWWFLPVLVICEEEKTEKVRSLCMEKLQKPERFGREITCLGVSLTGGHVALIIWGKENRRELSFWLGELEGISEFAGKETESVVRMFLGQYAGDDLPVVIGDIVEYYGKMVPAGSGVCLVDKSNPPELKVPEGAVWGRWLVRKDLMLVKNQIVNLLRYAERQQYLSVGYLQTVLHSFLEACSIACYAQGKKLAELFDDSFTYEEMLGCFSSVDELCEGVDYCLRQYEKTLVEKGEDEGFSSVPERIQDVLRYLDMNMDRMISRREAAKYVFLNEDYFSRVFRRETGMGYKEYVLKMKMDYAGKLLADTDMPVTMIASKVGYGNFTNFTQMFRKYTKVTPTEYRKQNQKSENQ